MATFRTWPAKTLTASLLLLLLSTTALAQTGAEQKQAERETRIGMLVGRGDTFTIFSPQAKRDDNSAVCTMGSAVAHQSITEAERLFRYCFLGEFLRHLSWVVRL